MPEQIIQLEIIADSDIESFKRKVNQFLKENPSIHTISPANITDLWTVYIYYYTDKEEV